MSEGFYSFHDLLTVRLHGPAARFAKVDKEYSYYRTEMLAGEPDIDFDMHPFAEPALPGAVTVDKKYQLADGRLYAADRYKVAFWKVLLEDLGTQPTRVRFAGNGWSMVIVVKFFLEPLIRIKTTLGGRMMVHSSCLSDGERGFMLAASPSTGKTTTLLNWLGAGHPFVSDEYTILDEQGAIGYVTPFRFHAHNLKMNPILQGMPDYAKWQIRLRTALLKATGGYGDVTYNIGVREALPQVPIADRAPCTSVFVITRADVDRPTAGTGDKEAIIGKLQAINFYELRQFVHYLKAWTYAWPESDIARYFEIERDNMRRLLADRPCREVLVPAAYTDGTFNQLIELLYELDK